MKKLVSFIIIITLVCGLCGCELEPPNEEKYTVEVWIIPESTGVPVAFECKTYYPGSSPIINEIEGIDFCDVQQISISPIDGFAYNIVSCCSQRYYATDSKGWGGTTCRLHSADDGPERSMDLHIVDAEGYSKKYVTLTLRFLG